MAFTIKLKRGNEVNKPNNLQHGEVYLAMDTNTIWVGQGSGQADKKFITGGSGNIELTNVSSNILPSSSNSYDIGSPTQRFKNIYVDEAHLSVNTLYLGDTPVMGTEQSNVVVKADPNQSISLKTSGIGITSILSESGVLIKTDTANSNVNIQTTGSGADIQATSAHIISLNAPNINLTGSTSTTVNGNFTVIGNLNVNGTTTTVNSQQLEVKDNIIVVNSGQIGNGVTAGQAGIKIDRGDLPDYLMVYDETNQTINVGQQGSLVPITTTTTTDTLYVKLSDVVNTSTADKIVKLDSNGKINQNMLASTSGIQTKTFAFIGASDNAQSAACMVDEAKLLTKIRVFSTTSPSAITTVNIMRGASNGSGSFTQIGTMSFTTGTPIPLTLSTPVQLNVDDVLYAVISGSINGMTNLSVQIVLS